MNGQIKVWSYYTSRKDPHERNGLPYRKTDGKGKPEGKSDKKPLPPNGLWVGRYNDTADVDCGDALNE